MRRLRIVPFIIGIFSLLVLPPLQWDSRAAEPTMSGGQTPLDSTLRPEEKEEVSNVFKDMGVIQRRAMVKGGRFLFSTFGTFDFSDGPYTNYSVHLNPGYAISDFLEVYLNFAPFYIVSARSIVSTIQNFTNNGTIAPGSLTITAARPKSQFGLDVVWAPAYGKDSISLHRVIRSDTFFKFGVANITYDSGPGMKFTAGIGKTYFLGHNLGFRFCADFGYLQTIINNVKAFRSMALMELGAVFYL